MPRQLLLDMVHHTPGEPLTSSKFCDPRVLAGLGYDAQVINDFVPPQAAITYAGLGIDCFPDDPARAWLAAAKAGIHAATQAAQSAGILAFYFSDVLVLPRRLRDHFGDLLCDPEGRLDIGRPKTREVLRAMIAEVFETFPTLDGLVIRTGECYLNNLPYHVGNSPILDGVRSHIALLKLLREEICEVRHKWLIYRTWDFDELHIKPDLYRAMSDAIEPHERLLFAAKHTAGDFHRVIGFNPTLGIGRHRQLVEVQCQREVEGKGAYPNYIAHGVIEGFEEATSQSSPRCLRDLTCTETYAGVLSWSRGGGFGGPYLKSEFWPELNVAVLSSWHRSPKRSEEEIFLDCARAFGFSGSDAERLRELCLTAARAIVRGRATLLLPSVRVDASPSSKFNLWWTRDHFLGGLDALRETLDELGRRGLLEEARQEKFSSVALWEQVAALGGQLESGSSELRQHIVVSAEYGRLLYTAIAHAWNVFIAQRQALPVDEYASSFAQYDEAWQSLERLASEYDCCATLYRPYSWKMLSNDWHAIQLDNEQREEGMQADMDRLRVPSAAPSTATGDSTKHGEREH